MHQASGERSNSNSRGSEGGRAPGLMGEKQPKIIQVPQFEKVELNRLENVCVRPSVQDEDSSGNAKEMKVTSNLITVEI